MSSKLTTNLLARLLTVIFFGFIFVISISPLHDADIWFHVKMGELFAQKGLVYQDFFSYTAQGREMMPYEWVFQWGSYLIQQTFGFDSLRYFTAVFQTAQVFVLFLILRRILKVNVWYSLAICFTYQSVILEFVTARPHLMAYTFYITTIYLVLEFIKTGIRKWLFPLIPMVILWSNTHGSMFLATALLTAYAVVALIYYFISKDQDWLKKFLTLSVAGIVSVLLTILPPLGFGQYQLLWKFYQHRELLTNFISEWAPLSTNEFGFVFYTLFTLTIYIGLGLYLVFSKKYKEVILLLPLLPLPLFSFLATRNVLIGMISLSIISGWLLSRVRLKFKSWSGYLFYGLFTCFLLWMGYIMYIKKLPQRLYYPVNAVNFIDKYDLQGNMFNEYGYGGYMLYHLYPKKQVFFDGRTEMYLCCEMPDTLELSYKKNESDANFKAVMDWIWNKYHISYTIMRSQKHSVLRRIDRILTEDPNWSLVFWDDNSLIYVRKDGKNDQIIKNLGVAAATPYNQNPYREGMEDQALSEYQRMLKVVDSAKSRNAIGYIFLKKGQFNEAFEQFQLATRLDPSNESPFMNLAEFAAKDKNYNQAIEYYEKALLLAPDRGLIYIRLGQLYLQNGDGLDKARSIWQKGVTNTIDEEAKARLQQLLETK